MLVCFVIFTLAWFIQVVFYLLVGNSLWPYRAKPIAPLQQWPAVSVIVCARNEEQNLTEHLPKLLEQNYPQFEVVVVNDGSSDGSAALLEKLSLGHECLRIVGVSFGNKKKALQAGVQAAKHNLLLFTDADCQPASPNWITHMANAYETDTEIVLGYGAYQYQPGLLNKIIRFETIFTAVQYFTAALMKLPYMGVGRNLSYTKALFQRSNALHQTAQVLSGDDDLLVNEMANNHNTQVQLHPDATTISKPETTWAAWLHQKHRHSEAGHYYKWPHRLVLGMLYSSQAIFYPAMFVLFFSETLFLWAAVLFFVRFVLQLFIYGKILRYFNGADLLKWLWICDFFISLFLSSLALLTAFKVNTWKKNLPNRVERKKTWSWLN